MSFSNLKENVRAVLAAKLNAADSPIEVRDARDYVSSMTQVIQSTSEQQYMAMQKVTNLSKSLAKMENKLARLDRVEAENKSLSARTAALETDLSEKTNTARDLDSQLSVTKRQLKIAQDELLALRADIAGRKEKDASVEGRLDAKTSQVSALTAKLSQLEQRQLDLKARNRSLEEELSQSQGEVSLHRRSATEFVQKLEELERSEAATRRSFDAVTVELNGLKSRFDDINENYIEAQAQLESAKFEFRSTQTQHADSLRRREEENLSLQNRIAHLEAQLRIKESAKIQAEREITEVQHSLRLANMRADQAETMSREISREAEASALNVISSQSDYDALNAKFMTALEDIATLKKLTQIQKSKLMQYAAVDSAPVLTSGVSEEIEAPLAPKAAQNEAAHESSQNIRILRQLKPAS